MDNNPVEGLRVLLGCAPPLRTPGTVPTLRAWCMEYFSSELCSFATVRVNFCELGCSSPTACTAHVGAREHGDCCPFSPIKRVLKCDALVSYKFWCQFDESSDTIPSIKASNFPAGGSTAMVARAYQTQQTIECQPSRSECCNQRPMVHDDSLDLQPKCVKFNASYTLFLFHNISIYCHTNI